MEGKEEYSFKSYHKRAASVGVIGKYGDEGASISDIANDLSFTLPTITVAINKLVKKGYVTKRKSEEDKRMVYVTLTKMGKKVDNVHRYIHLKITRKS